MIPAVPITKNIKPGKIKSLKKRANIRQPQEKIKTATFNILSSLSIQYIINNILSITMKSMIRKTH
jgi:hypothetical protein